MSEIFNITHEGELNLNGLIIPCYVLENGDRVLSTVGMQRALGIVENSAHNASSGRLDQILSSRAVSRFISNDSDSAKYSPIMCFEGNKKISAYHAYILPEICEIMLKVRDHAKINKLELGSRQQAVIEQSDILVRALARVGITALIDEATGYQNDVNRAKDELQQLLSKLLLSEQAKWIKTFPDEFFEMIFRMKHWNWTKAARRPQVIGHYINDFIYSRIAPVLLDELKRKNPVNENTGNRKSKHHQWLTPDLGHPKLKEHISGIMALGRASGFDWLTFLHILDRSYPKFGHTMKILFPGEIETKPKLPPLSEFNNKLNTALKYNPKKGE